MNVEREARYAIVQHFEVHYNTKGAFFSNFDNHKNQKITKLSNQSKLPKPNNQFKLSFFLLHQYRVISFQIRGCEH